MAMPGTLLQLARNNPMTQAVKQMIGLVNASKNPQDTLKYLTMNNPQLKQVMEIISASGGDAMKAFENMAKKNGVDPNEILAMIKE